MYSIYSWTVLDNTSRKLKLWLLGKLIGGSTDWHVAVNDVLKYYTNEVGFQGYNAAATAEVFRAIGSQRGNWRRFASKFHEKLETHMFIMYNSPMCSWQVPDSYRIRLENATYRIRLHAIGRKKCVRVFRRCYRVQRAAVTIACCRNTFLLSGCKALWRRVLSNIIDLRSVLRTIPTTMFVLCNKQFKAKTHARASLSFEHAQVYRSVRRGR